MKTEHILGFMDHMSRGLPENILTNVFWRPGDVLVTRLEKKHVTATHLSTTVLWCVSPSSKMANHSKLMNLSDEVSLSRSLHLHADYWHLLQLWSRIAFILLVNVELKTFLALSVTCERMQTLLVRTGMWREFLEGPIGSFRPPTRSATQKFTGRGTILTDKSCVVADALAKHYALNEFIW